MATVPYEDTEYVSQCPECLTISLDPYNKSIL